MFLVENDDVVQELSPCRTHQAFGDPILPRTSIAGPLGTQCHGGHGADHLGGEDGIAIEEQVFQAPWRDVKGEGFPELLDNPWSPWEFGDVPVKNLPPRVSDGEPDVEEAEGSGGDDKDIHRDDELSMVPQEGEPALPLFRPRVPPPQVARDGTLGDAEPEPEQFSVGNRSRPKAP